MKFHSLSNKLFKKNRMNGRQKESESGIKWNRFLFCKCEIMQNNVIFYFKLILKDFIFIQKNFHSIRLNFDFIRSKYSQLMPPVSQGGHRECALICNRPSKEGRMLQEAIHFSLCMAAQNSSVLIIQWKGWENDSWNVLMKY